jgi:UDP-N-acetylmuramoyl-L-alanyl-D-glutamate--2,6-diaminopimelate ligase
MVERGVRVCMMEVSSHALVMGRVDGVVFDVACFTNLGRDHLDFHADEEAYFAAKASLFTPERARRGLVNADDAHGRRLLDAEPSIPMASYALEEPAEWQAIDVVSAPAATTFVVSHGDARYRSTVPLPGSYNVSNALCAVAACGEAGLDPAAVAAGLADSEGVPGRLERVDAGQPYLAVVDYAHKPDAVEAALTAVRPQTRRRLIVVIGAGGDRDAGKRPLMAATAAALADIVVITDDNPRSEDPSAIRAAMRAGIPADTAAQVHEVGDRRAAIRLAVSLAEEGDALVVAGKGHEKGQEIDGTVYPFDDREVLVEEIRAAR